MNQSGNDLIGKFVWFDLLTENVEAEKDFYEELFGWDVALSKQDPNYILIKNKGTAIGGIVARKGIDETALESLWIVWLSVEDVDQATQLLIAQGRQALAGPIEDPLEPSWLPHIGVQDIDHTVQKAKRQGGRVFVRIGNVVIIEDPSGGTIGLQQF